MIRYICVLALTATLVVMGGPVAAQSQVASAPLPYKIDAIAAAVSDAGTSSFVTAATVLTWVCTLRPVGGTSGPWLHWSRSVSTYPPTQGSPFLAGVRPW